MGSAAVTRVLSGRVVAGGLALAFVAGACGGAPSGSESGRAPAARNAGSDCLTGEDIPVKSEQYFRLTFQLRSCLPFDIPFAVDVSPTGGGKYLKDAGTNGPGGDVAGAAILWDAGDGQGVRREPSSVIPKGSGTGYGALVGFSTVPYWNGFMPSQFGPCANSIHGSDNSGKESQGNKCAVDYATLSRSAKLEFENNFSGQWAIYLPTQTIIASIQATAPFPYVPEAFATQKDRGKGALATGIVLARRNPSGQYVPFYSTSSTDAEKGAPKSPKASTFIASTCADNLSVVNGGNADNTKVGNWSTLFAPGSRTTQGPALKPYNLTVNTTLGGDLPVPALFLTKGWLATQDGKYSTIPLGNKQNLQAARQQHTFQAVMKEISSASCASGSSNTNNIAMVGARADSLSLAASNSASLLIANSTLENADFLSTSATNGRFIFSLLTKGSNLTGTDLSNADLTGSVMDDVDFGEGSVQHAKFFYADLSRATINGNETGALYCHTLMPDQTVNDSNCNEMGNMADRQEWKDPDTTACAKTNCISVRFYNNTTRYLSQGLAQCSKGSVVGGIGGLPNAIPPLSTEQFTYQPRQNEKDVTCAVTYTNGPWGKVRISISNKSGKWETKVDGGYCGNVTPEMCLPKAAPAVPADPSQATGAGLWPLPRADNAPVKVDSSSASADKGAYQKLDISICEPEAFDRVYRKCDSKAALPIPQPHTRPSDAAR